MITTTDYRGENVPTAKLTEQDVRQIRTLGAQGVSLSVLGKRFGVSGVTIFNVLHRLKWRHVDASPEELTAVKRAPAARRAESVQRAIARAQQRSAAAVKRTLEREQLRLARDLQRVRERHLDNAVASINALADDGTQFSYQDTGARLVLLVKRDGHLVSTIEICRLDGGEASHD